MSRVGCSSLTNCWRSMRRYNYGVICLVLTFITTLFILPGIRNMHIQVHRSFLAFSRRNDSLLTLCSEIRTRLSNYESQNVDLPVPAGSKEPVTAMQAPVVMSDKIPSPSMDLNTAEDSVSCDVTQFKDGLPVAGDDRNQSVTDICPAKPSSLFGRYSPSMIPLSMNELVSMFPMVLKGGHYTPRWCKPVEKTLIIIPYRSRCSHLYTLLPNLYAMLIRQNVAFTIYVVEQVAQGKFNKGILFNTGFLEGLKRQTFDCVIFHDVDLIPINDLNIYRCNKTGPTHFSPIVSKYNFKELYSGLFGGVVGFTVEQFKLINGASNVFFGWGAEDDDLRNRAFVKKLPLLRKRDEIGVYYMVKHKYEPGWERNPDRIKLFAAGKDRQRIDGINSVKYNITNVIEFPMFTWFGVDYDKNEIIKAIPPKLLKGKVSTSNFYEKAHFIYI